VRHRPAVIGLAVVLTVLLVGAVGLYVGLRSVTRNIALPDLGPACTVTADGTVGLDAVQMANAATITAVGVRLGMPEKAVVVALATAFQESGLENLEHGDRDSIGLFQQRPSQGWGSVEQISDPRYAAGKFYDKLKRIKGWQDMRVTDAAQKVQRSAFPEAYEKWADESTVLARALVGNATGAVDCSVPGEPSRRGPAALTALTDALRADWGRPEAAADAAVNLTVAAADAQAGWRYAHWLVAHATDHGVERVRYGALEWRAPEGAWKPVDGAPQDAHVSAQVYGDEPAG
jgi:hypothetical protein